MKILRIILFLSLLVSINAFAGEKSEIVLTDGSKFFGEILSFSNGVYHIKTVSLGVIDIKESQIRLVRVKPERTTELPKASAGSDKNIQSDIETLRNSIMNNAEVMAMVLALQDDPEIQKAMADPVIMEAVNAGDVGAFISNPKILKLLSDPRIQEIQKKLGTDIGNMN